MDSIRLENHKVIVVHDDDSTEETDTLLGYLECPIDSISDFLFRDLWALLKKDYQYYDLIFFQSLGKRSLKNFFKDAEAYHEDDSEDDRLTCVEVSYMPKIWSQNGEMNFGIWYDFNGKGFHEGIPDQKFSVGMQPISNYMHLPLVVDEKIAPVLDKKRVNFGKKSFTIFELIGAVLDEITYHGNPVDRAAAFAELEQRFSEAKDIVKKMQPKTDKHNDD